MAKLELWFDSFANAELLEAKFSHRCVPKEIHIVRGRTGGAYGNLPTFHWSSAVKALTSLLVGSRAAQEFDCNSSGKYWLVGTKGTLAASLDYALSKQPLWLFDMFGQDSSGCPHARRLVLRSNPERKRPGPVVLSLNTNFLHPSEIYVHVAGELVDSRQDLQRLALRITQENSQASDELFPSVQVGPTWVAAFGTQLAFLLRCRCMYPLLRKDNGPYNL